MPCKHLNLLISGPPRVGKTTVVQKLLAIFERALAGYYTQAVENSYLTDYRLVTVAGRQRKLSPLPLIHQFSVPGIVGLRPDQLRTSALNALEHALKQYPIIIIDEIGRLETWVPELRQTIQKCFDAPQIVIATIPSRPRELPTAVDLGFLDELRGRSDVEEFTITSANRTSLAEDLASRICEILGPYGKWKLP